jgi:hypothetical protein
MKAGVAKEVIIVIILSMSLIQAQNISIEYPPEVFVDEEFEVSVLLVNFSGNVYDLKFDIKNGNKNLAHVQVDEDWKSTHYWIKEAFVNESTKKFHMKITESYEGAVPLIVKLREGTYVETFEGNELAIHNQESEEGEEEEKEEGSIEIDWNDDKIVNGEEFEIAIKGFISGEDIRLWIEKSGEIISERYDTKNEEWKSGLFYVNDFECETLELRMKSEYSSFEGDAFIKVKIRNGEEHSETIKILKKEIVENDDEIESTVDKGVIKSDGKEFTEAVIQLGTGKIVQKVSSDDGDQNEVVVYESKNEKIKIYVVFGFALLCVGLCVLIAWGKIG